MLRIEGGASVTIPKQKLVEPGQEQGSIRTVFVLTGPRSQRMVSAIRRHHLRLGPYRVDRNRPGDLTCWYALAMDDPTPQWRPRTNSSKYFLPNHLVPAAIDMARIYTDIMGKTAKAVRVVIEDDDGESAEIRIELPAEMVEYPKPDE
jgi:hypothetical protein